MSTSNSIEFGRSYEAVVVGARCAGAATAMLLARSGLNVLLVDADRYGSDTLSTHALMRGGVLQLARWGLLPEVVASGPVAIHRTTFHYADEQVPVDIEARDGVDALYAPRRRALDAVLADAAMAAGADVRFGVRAVDLTRDSDGRVSGVVLRDATSSERQVRAGIVIGADGVRSTIARLTAAPDRYRLRHAAGTVYGYFSGLDLDGYHWHYRPGVSVGAIPTNDGLTCVFATIPAPRFAVDLRHGIAGIHATVLAECAPDLADAVADAPRQGPLRGFPGQAGFVRRSQGPGWALVGDAAWFKDPITAHGITDALRDAELLARAVATGGQGALEDYERQRDELSLRMFGLADAIASFDWDLSLVKRLHRAFSRAMKDEIAAIQSWDAPAPRVANASWAGRSPQPTWASAPAAVAPRP